MGASGAAKVTKIGIGSKAWSNKVRKQAKDLARALDTGYVELSLLLWRIHDTPIENDPNKPAIYEQWGYKTFGEYAEKELHLVRRKAERLRSIGMLLDVQLVDIDAQTKRRLTKIGWSKLRELVRVFAKKNDKKTVLKWVEKAENSNYPQLLSAVGKYLDYLDETPSGPKEAEKGSKGGHAVLDDEEDLPDLDRTHTFHFLCFNEQIDNVREALERAEELIDAQGGDGAAAKKSNLLSLICMDFLATNDFGKKMDPKTRSKFLAQLEVHMGVKLIAVNSSGFVHGKKTFNQVIKGMED